jgi:hypothetical protein
LNFPDLTTKASLAVIFDSALRAVEAAGLAFELIKMGSTYREYRSSYPLINKIMKAFSNWSVFKNLSIHLWEHNNLFTLFNFIRNSQE